MYSRDLMVTVMRGWLGAYKGDNLHKTILNIYNSYKPLPRGYAMTVNDPWCAATVSAASIACGYTDIIPPECSCTKMIELFKKKNEWKEADNYVPLPGDIIFYDWEDSGVGDCVGTPNHVGVVESCAGGKITVIEGNYSKQVKRRVINVNGRYIRGFGLPKYDDIPMAVEALTIPTYYIAVKGDTLTSVCKKFNIKKENFIKNNNLSFPYWLYAGRKYIL